MARWRLTGAGQYDAHFVAGMKKVTVYHSQSGWKAYRTDDSEAESGISPEQAEDMFCVARAFAALNGNVVGCPTFEA